MRVLRHADHKGVSLRCVPIGWTGVLLLQSAAMQGGSCRFREGDLLSPTEVPGWLSACKIVGGSVVASCLIMFIGIVFFLERLEALRAVIWGWFAPLGARAKKRAIGSKIRSRVITVSKALNREMGAQAILPDLKIVWMEKDSPESFVRNNQVVILMRYADNPAENVVSVLYQYAQCGFLQSAKVHLDRPTCTSLDLTITRKWVVQVCSDHINFFVHNVLNPLQKDEEIADLTQMLLDIDRSGMFTQIVVREVREKGDSLIGQPPDIGLKSETREFVRFVHTIATKRTGDPHVPLDFFGVYFRVSVLILGIPEKLAAQGLNPYIKRIRDALNAGSDNIYVLSGRNRMTELNGIKAAILDDPRITEFSVFVAPYANADGKRIVGSCLRICTVPSAELRSLADSESA